MWIQGAEMPICPHCGHEQYDTNGARGYDFTDGNSYIHKCDNCGKPMQINWTPVFECVPLREVC